MKTIRIMALVIALAMVVAACAAEPAATTAAGGTDTTAAGGTDTTAAGGTDTTAAGGTETTAGAAGETPYDHLNQAYAGEFEGTEVVISAQWIEAEEESFNAALQPFRDATGIDVVYEPLTDYETALQTRVDGGDPPDLAQIAQPGLMQRYASEGFALPLDWINQEQLEADVGPVFSGMSKFEDTVYGVFYKTDVKSIVWYPPAAFEEAGYEIPTTWDELIALSDQIIADGNGNPWCFSVRHTGANDGWLATDWFEDVVLRTAPPETYEAWITHDIAFNDPEILEAAEYISQIWFSPDYVIGGTDGMLATNIEVVQDPMFNEDGPGCWMQKQAAWIPGFWPEGTVAGEDSAFFYFPPIEEEFGSPVLGAGDMFIMFDDRPEVRATLEFLATPEGAQGWIESDQPFLSPNTSVPLEWYRYPQTDLAPIVAEATYLGFDASDLMPAEVGSGTFWTGMLDWIGADGENTEEIFQGIEDSWPSG
jgi:alpha-glucoside transport system substrate-binding protein